MAKLPAFQFYPGDWLRDPVSGCSLAAQGLWLRLMILMHDSERYGYLAINGSAIPSDQLARRCGCSPAEYELLFAELESAGIPRRTKDGIIFSKRMSEDADERAKNAERQRRHYEKTKAVPNASSNGQPNGDLTATSRKPHTPSSSSSSSSKKKETPNGDAPVGASNGDPRSRHPAIQAVRRYTVRYPNRLAYDAIIQAVGDKPDEGRLKKCAEAWAQVSGNMLNLVWVTDWYVNGIPEKRVRAANAAHDPTVGAR